MPFDLHLYPVPKAMKELPLFRGLPIPYSTFVGEDRIPDFKVADERLRYKCLIEGLCGLCGKPLDKIIVLIGGPKCVKAGRFYDPPMHEECALYATKVCPYLSDPNWEYAKQPPRHLKERQTVIKTYEQISNKRPDRIAVCYYKSYDMIRERNAWFIKVRKPFKINWDACGKKSNGL